MNLENVKREDWIVGGLALLLIITLVALPWFSLPSATLLGVTYGGDLVGTDAPDGWLCILAILALLALIADLAVERFSPQTQVPVLNSRAHTRFVLAAVAAALIVLKFLFHLGHVGDLGWGFFVDIIVTAALVYTALQVRNGAPIPGAGSSAFGGRSAGAPGAGAPPAGAGAPPAGAGTPPAGVGVPPAGAGTPPIGEPPAGGTGVGGGPAGPPPTPGV